MRGLRWAALGAAVGAAVALMCGGGVTALLISGAKDTPEQPKLASCGSTATVAAAVPAVSGYTPDQVTNASVIVRVGQEMTPNPRAYVIAVATAMQESTLRNLGDLGAKNDHDSLGLFQQRPSQGWGTPEQVRDPAYASRKFYDGLLKVSGWERLPLTVAAQAVQKSAFPGAYAKHETKAAQLVGVLTGGANRAAERVGTCATAGQVTAGGWTQPVPGGVTSKWKTAERPTHYGVDLEAAKRTPIKAVTSGTVIKAVCDGGTLRTVGSCDVDGSPKASGCGWYVDLRHAGGIITRYCHMIERPMVTAGQQVAAGQQLGWSGSSGNSSGPHLHFEVHRNNDERARTGSIDPVPFMREHGAPLGGKEAQA